MDRSLIKVGSVIRLPDGREATIVSYSFLGIGCRLGRHIVNINQFFRAEGLPWFACDLAEWQPDILLRRPWAGCERNGWKIEECVCEPEEVEFIN